MSAESAGCVVAWAGIVMSRRGEGWAASVYAVRSAAPQPGSCPGSSTWFSGACREYSPSYRGLRGLFSWMWL